MNQPTDQHEVALYVEKLRKAMIDADRQALENLAADNLSYGHSNGNIEDKVAFVENIAGGKSVFVTIELSGQTISISNDTVIVRHTFNATTNDGGKPATIKLKILLVWQKINGQLKLVARQAVRMS